MYTLRLVKGLSYAGVVYATKDNPVVFVEDEEVAAKALATGYFAAVGAVPPAGLGEAMSDLNSDPPDRDDEDEDEDGDEDQTDDIHKMTKEQLILYAEQHDVDLTGCTSKKAILAQVEEYEAGMAAKAALLAQD